MVRPRLFRGSELPRLMLLLGLAGVGWAWYFLKGGPRVERPAPARIADLQPPIAPDVGPGFAGVTDRAPMTTGDNPAIAELLRRTREKTPGELARISRREVLFTQLVDHPELYRGVPIRIDGTARRVLVDDHISPALTPRRRLVQAWTFTNNSMGYPLCLWVEDPPADLAIGDDLFERVYFDGYFLKLMSYQARDGSRFAPLLVGRIGKYGAAAPSGPLVPLPKGWTRSHSIVAGLGLFTFLGLFRVLALLRRQRTPTWRPSATFAPSDRIEPEALADWLKTDAPEAAEDWAEPYRDDEDA